MPCGRRDWPGRRSSRMLRCTNWGRPRSEICLSVSEAGDPVTKAAPRNRLRRPDLTGPITADRPDHNRQARSQQTGPIRGEPGSASPTGSASGGVGRSGVRRVQWIAGRTALGRQRRRRRGGGHRCRRGVCLIRGGGRRRGAGSGCARSATTCSDSSGQQETADPHHRARPDAAGEVARPRTVPRGAIARHLPGSVVAELIEVVHSGSPSGHGVDLAVV
jgi:hypothetical protein